MAKSTLNIPPKYDGNGFVAVYLNPQDKYISLFGKDSFETEIEPVLRGCKLKWFRLEVKDSFQPIVNQVLVGLNECGELIPKTEFKRHIESKLQEILTNIN